MSEETRSGVRRHYVVTQKRVVMIEARSEVEAELSAASSPDWDVVSQAAHELRDDRTVYLSKIKGEGPPAR